MASLKVCAVLTSYERKFMLTTKYALFILEQHGLLCKCIIGTQLSLYIYNTLLQLKDMISSLTGIQEFSNNMAAFC